MLTLVRIKADLSMKGLELRLQELETVQGEVRAVRVDAGSTIAELDDLLRPFAPLRLLLDSDVGAVPPPGATLAWRGEAYIQHSRTRIAAVRSPESARQG